VGRGEEVGLGARSSGLETGHNDPSSLFGALLEPNRAQLEPN